MGAGPGPRGRGLASPWGGARVLCAEGGVRREVSWPPALLRVPGHLRGLQKAAVRSSRSSLCKAGGRTTTSAAPGSQAAVPTRPLLAGVGLAPADFSLPEVWNRSSSRHRQSPGPSKGKEGPALWPSPPRRECQRDTDQGSPVASPFLVEERRGSCPICCHRSRGSGGISVPAHGISRG